MSRVDGAIINGDSGGDSEHRLPNVSNISFDGVDGESLLIALDLKGIAVSTGSACASGSLEPSHVLTAMGLSREQVRGSLRFSFSKYNTSEQVDIIVSELEQIIRRLREMLPEKLETSSAEP